MRSIEAGEASLRVVVLTAMYAAAVAVAFAFSPAGGFVGPEQLSAAVQAGRTVTPAR